MRGKECRLPKGKREERRTRNDEGRSAGDKLSKGLKRNREEKGGDLVPVIAFAHQKVVRDASVAVGLVNLLPLPTKMAT